MRAALCFSQRSTFWLHLAFSVQILENQCSILIHLASDSVHLPNSFYLFQEEFVCWDPVEDVASVWQKHRDEVKAPFP